MAAPLVRLGSGEDRDGEVIEQDHGGRCQPVLEAGGAESEVPDFVLSVVQAIGRRTDNRFLLVIGGYFLRSTPCGSVRLERFGMFAKRCSHLSDERDEKFAEHEATLLKEHLADFLRVAIANGNNEVCVGQSGSYIHWILDRTKTKRISDLSLSSVQEVIAEVRKKVHQYGKQLCSFHESAQPLALA